MDRVRMAHDRATPRAMLVALAGDDQDDVREAATQTIIDLMDTEAMTACGDAALAAGDFERGEFWFMEVATADADENVRADGIEALARRIYIPLGRLHEAELYTRNAVLRADGERKARAERTLADINGLWIAHGSDGLVFNDQWRQADIMQPAHSGMTQQEHYYRMVAYMFHRDGTGEHERTIELLQSDFMQGITGYILGMSRGKLKELGMQRETVVKATADWLAHRKGPRFP